MKYTKRVESSYSDLENDRPPTEGELAFYGAYPAEEPNPGTAYRSQDRGLTGPVTKGPLAGLDLVAYMRGGPVRRLDGRPLTTAQAALR